MMLFMPGRHMFRLGGHAIAVLAHMTGHPFVLEEQFDELIFGMQLKLFTHQLMGNRVKMLLILDVVVDVDLDGLDGRVFIRMFG